jgi:NTE family protein
LGLALGGGAARGFAHIGVLKALDEAGIKPSFVAGTSVGSLVGALYCAGIPWQTIWKEAEALHWKSLVKFALPPTMGLVHTEKLEDLVHRLTGDATIEQLSIPFRAVAVDLTIGKEVVFDRGSIGRAVRASCSIPGVFIPLEEGQQVLADGGVLNNVPADVCREMGADFVLSVDLLASGWDRQKRPENLMEVMLFSTFLLMDSAGARGRELSDLVVVPDLASYPIHDMTHRQEVFDCGYQAMKRQAASLGKRFS